MTSSVHNATLPLEISRVATPLRNMIAFLMLGGASLILMGLFFLVRQPQILMRDDVRLMLQELSGGALLFVVLLSYPHFVWSYRFAYQQGFAFIRRHSWQLIVYPLVVTGLLTLCVLSWNYPVSNFSILRTIETNFQMVGINLNWSLYKGFGQLLFAGLLIVQVVMSGHHYCMQALGVALAGGEEHGYKLTSAQKKILRINLYALWAMNLLSGFAFLAILNNRTFAYHSFQLPAPLSMASYAVFAVTFALVVWKVILPQKALPPFQAAIPILSVWLWLQPFVQPYGYQFLVVPIAHGAQNLFFAYKVELNNFDASRKLVKSAFSKALFLVLLSVAAMVIGYLSFHTIPVMLDRARLIADVSPNFFFLGAFILISTHHYILDSVVWRHDSRARIVLQPTKTAI
ncbi:MAG: hypothetical protein HYX67_00320 [Candidatus Melainabacteria bacterium]|nr:hypothetical protein [Candidatus Melainabacteria bacterium]